MSTIEQEETALEDQREWQERRKRLCSMLEVIPTMPVPPFNMSAARQNGYGDEIHIWWPDGKFRASITIKGWRRFEAGPTSQSWDAWAGVKAQAEEALQEVLSW